ncbi:MAG: hypothetical protein PHG53_09460 [Phycisphaerae bacterium]|nr:hypothetical protein [Phycisphaerae bacterium]
MAKKETKAHQTINEQYQIIGCLNDSRPVKHEGNEPATDEVLKDMATEDALDEMDW